MIVCCKAQEDTGCGHGHSFLLPESAVASYLRKLSGELYTVPTIFLFMTENRNKPYKNKAWYRIRQTVLDIDKGLCQRCLGNYMSDGNRPKRFTKAVLVHHHYKVEEYPQYKYQMYVKRADGSKVRNLYSLCAECHEAIHADTHRNHHSTSTLKMMRNDDFTTEERWD